MANLNFDVNANDDASAAFAAIAAQAQNLKNQLDDLDGRRARVRVDLTAPSAAQVARVEALRTALQDLDGVNARATVGITGIPTAADTRRLRNAADALRDLDGANATANVAITGIPTAADVRRIRQAIDALRDLDGIDARASVRITGTGSLDPVEIRAAAAALRALERIGVINIRINIFGADAALRDVLQLNAALRALPRFVPIRIGVSGGEGLSGPGGIVPSLLTAIALAPALTAAGAAITAVWGAVSTAIAAAPAALALLAAPIAAVVLGMDGIKVAAQTLQPEFDALRAAVSAAFETGLTPVFERLAAIFPTLQAGLVGTAESLSFVADRIVDIVTSAEGIEQLEAIFEGVNRAINEMSPGLEAIVSGMLRVASNGAAFDVIVEAVNRFGIALDESIARLDAGGTLDAAFSALGDLLGELGEAFVGLVENGIEVFVGAGPGLSAVVDSITDFFGRFDWGRLGAAAGEALQGIASAIDGIDDQTIEDITKSFEGLGDTLQSPEFAAAVQAIADVVPIAVDAINELNVAFTELAPILSEVTQGANDAQESLYGSGFDAGVAVREFLISAWQDITTEIEKGSASAVVAVIDAGQLMSDAWRGSLQGVEDAVNDTFSAISAQVGTGLPPINLTVNAAEAISGLQGWAGMAAGTVGIAILDAEIALAMGRTLEWAGQAAGAIGMSTLDANPAPAITQIGGWAAQAAGTVGMTILDAQIALAVGRIGEWVGQALAAVGVTTMDANPAPAFSQLGAYVAQVAGTIATALLDANPAPAQGVLGAIVSQINATVGTMTIAAVDGPARAVLDAVIATVNAAIGIMTIDGNNAPAMGKTSAAKSFADGTTGTMTVDANTGPAIAAARAAASAISAMTATIVVTTVRRTITEAVSGVFGGAQGGVIRPMATGGVLGRGVMGRTSTGHPVAAYARGGFGSFMGNRLSPMLPRAAAVPPNTWRVVGDNMRHTEVYIPLNGSERSLNFTRFAAQAQGFELTPAGPRGAMPSGGMHSMPARVPTTSGARVRAGHDGSAQVVQAIAAMHSDLRKELHEALADRSNTFHIHGQDVREGAHASRMLLRSMK